MKKRDVQDRMQLKLLMDGIHVRTPESRRLEVERRDPINALVTTR